jgi:DNA-3-methyladenine glycosylase II
MRGVVPLANTKSRTTPKHRIIEADSDVREGVRALRRKCEVMRRVHDEAGHPPLRRRAAGFEGLARIIVGQQLSVASAEAIWGRTVLAVQPFEPSVLLAMKDRKLTAAGLSAAKIRTLRAIAAATADGLDLTRLDRLSDEEVHAALTAVNGIGPWTADIFLMFCLGRADAWASGDLALQLAAQEAFGLEERPDKVALLELAERWRPWRGVAARLLWSYYAVVKQRKKVVPI